MQGAAGRCWCLGCGWLCIAHLAALLGIRAAWPLPSHFSRHGPCNHIPCTCVKPPVSQTIPKEPQSRACTPLNSSHHAEVRGNPLTLGSGAPKTLLRSSSPLRAPRFCSGPGSLGPQRGVAMGRARRGPTARAPHPGGPSRAPAPAGCAAPLYGC